MTNHMEAGLSLESDLVLKLMRENERLRELLREAYRFLPIIKNLANPLMILRREIKQELEKQDDPR